MGFRRAMMMTSNYVRSVIQSFVNYTSVFNAWYEADYCLERSLDDLNKKDLLNTINPGNPVNLLKQPEDFSNSYWGKGGVTITTDSINAPDGTLTADLISNTALNGYVTTSSSTSWPLNLLNTSYTVSAYIKVGTSTRTRITLTAQGPTITTLLEFIWTSGVPSTYAANLLNATNITYTNVGNGWYLISFTTVISTATANYIMTIYPAADVSPTGSIYLWGTQITQGTSLQTYIPQSTKSQPSLVITPNSYKEGFLYNVYPVVKNLLLNSGYFSTSPWSVGNATVTANAGIAPDGTSTAYLINVTAAFGQTSQDITIASGTSYNISCYMKAGTSTRSALALYNVAGSAFLGLLRFNWVSGAPVTFTSVGCSNIVYTSLPDGWYRISFSTTTVSASNRFYIYPEQTGATTGSVYIWGAQLEQGYNPTTYIQTYGSIIPTFTRTSLATILNSSGVVDSVPYQNLTRFSEQFNTTAEWTLSNITVTANVTLSPNGTVTADKLIESATNTVHYTYSANPQVISGNTYTQTTYFKAAERTNVRYGSLVAIAGANQSVVLDLTTGIVTVPSGSPIYTVTNVGNGWYRLSLTFTAIASGSGCNYIEIVKPPTAAGSPYLGDGTSGIYAWGAQVTQTSTVQTYFPTTNRFNVPRANYIVGETCPTLLIEPQRSNLYLNSATLVTQTNAVTTATAYTVSFYGTGTITFSGAYVGSLVGTGTNNLVFLTFTTTTTSLISTVTGSVINAQLEAGSFPTSYILTVATLVTRIADNLTIPTPYTSNLITSSGGTWLIDLKNAIPYIRDNVGGLYIGDSAINTSNCIVIRRTNTISTYLSISKYISGVLTTLYTLNQASSKIVIKWDGTYINVFINGIQVVTNSAFTTTNMNLSGMSAGAPTNIKTMALYPIPLTDAQCLSLSTQ